VPPGIVVGYHRIPVDQDILKELGPLGFDTDYVEKCVEANRHNHATTSYYLLLKKKLREGGKSPVDLSDPSFDAGLL
jgi:5'-AMP-activated protein kinase catalytic alpha subunit